jgi:hypothetical protein
LKPLCFALPPWLALCALGCSNASDAARDEDPCAASVDACILVEGGLAIGSGGPRAFRPFVPDEPQELVLGPQGGYMILPEFEIDPSVLGTDGAGALFTVAALVSDAATEQPPLEAPPLSGTLPRLTLEAGHYYVDPLPLLLSTTLSQVEGRACEITATFRDGGELATAAVRVSLVDEL